MKLNLPNYCIVNILSNKTVFPEIIEKGLTPENLYQNIKAINNDTPERQECIQGCLQLPKILHKNNASDQAALAIQELIQS